MKYGEIRLRNFRCFDWDQPATIEFRDGFTALIGPNNSGKSTALRAIFELRPLFELLPVIITEPLDRSRHVGLSSETDPAAFANSRDSSRFHVTLCSEIASSKRRIPYAKEVTFEFNTNNQMISVITVIAFDDKGIRFQLDPSSMSNLIPSGEQNIVAHKADNPKYIDFSSIVEFAASLYSSRYFPAARNAINEGAGKHYDCHIGTSFIGSWDSWKAGASRERKIAIRKVESEIGSLLGINRLEVNADQTNKTFDVFIDDHPHKLHEVGSGLAQLILTLSSALIERPDFICIDEPELCLHPGLQTRFMLTLGSYAKRGVIFATHSMGLARSVAQHIYSVHRAGPGKSTILPFGHQHPNLAEWLGELGYSALTNVGYDGLLLVEGQTEVLCFQEFLRKIGKDHKYVVLSLGGSSLIQKGAKIELAELTRLVPANRIRGYIDSERVAAEDELDTAHKEFLSTCGELGISMRVSDRRAIENYFTSSAIKSALGDESYAALEPFERLKDAQKYWSKSKNWLIVREMSMDDLKNTDLYEFLLAL